MRIALLSDIHANLEALEACLAHARSRDVEMHVLLGDFVGYGADACAVVAAVRRLVEAGGIALKGNHDAAMARIDSYFNDDARASLELARASLDDEQQRFLAHLPLTATRGSATFVHASAARPERWDYVDSPSAAKRSIDAAHAAYTFSGHVHDQELYFLGAGGKAVAFRPVQGSPLPVGRHRRWLALVGSVGQPRDNNPAAAYAQFDTERERMTFRRVPYDQLAAAEKIRQAGLPASIAYRVEKGI